MLHSTFNRDYEVTNLILFLNESSFSFDWKSLGEKNSLATHIARLTIKAQVILILS